jgi:S-adenosylmethionine synthetase
MPIFPPRPSDRPTTGFVPDSKFPLLIQPGPPYAPFDEVVERKGLGHPDTICDHLAEALAQALTRHFRERHGRRLHFNVDKALLAAGAVEVGFGGGRVLRPTRIVLAGKVDRRALPLPTEELVEAAYVRLFEILPWATREAYRIEVWLEASGDDLARLLERGAGDGATPLANDTSVATAFAGRSPLEGAVYQIERTLRSTAFRADHPVGADIKVLGTRFGDVHRFDVAVAVLAERVDGPGEYREVLEAVRLAVGRAVLAPLARPGGGDILIAVDVNSADQEPDGAYLTVTGSSAEAGDDGQVGRGNRIGGLITPCRLTSVEAACGKNPWAHVGKLYHAIAWDAAHALHAETGWQSVEVTLTSRIGQRVDRPERASVRAHVDDPSAVAASGPSVAELVQVAVADWAGAAERLEAGAYELA